MGSEKRVLVPIADGSEDLESVTIIDVLRRAGAKVTVASVMAHGEAKETSGAAPLMVTAARETKIVADAHIRDCTHRTFDMIALPGGMPGATNLSNCHELVQMLKEQKSAGRWYAAICASPAVVLARHHLIDADTPATCYPSFVKDLPNRSHVENRVIVHENCITSRGPGTAMEFSLKLVEVLYGTEKAAQLQSGMLVEIPAQ